MPTPEKRQKVTFIISQIDKAIGFEWIAENLDQSRFDLSFILLNEKPSYLAKFLAEKGITVHELAFSGRKQDLPRLLLKVIGLMRREKPDAIHTHMYIADLVGQFAGRLLGIKKRIYTRHSSNESRKYHKKQRIDRIINSLSTHVIAISENVKNILHAEENVPLERIRLIHHGFRLERFENIPEAEIEELAAKYNPQKKAPVIGVVARYSHWKGIQYAIAAFKRLLADYPDALLLLANAKKGDYKDEIAALLAELPDDSYYEIVFEHNLFALYQLFDVYVHLPIDAELEAFGQTYVEALAAGIPSVFTNSGVAREFIRDGENALVVDFQNSEQAYEAILRLLRNENLRKKLSETGKTDVEKMFNLEIMIAKMEKLYAE
jgi:glycosyltransferase involved in cell wall biosynthesis